MKQEQHDIEIKRCLSTINEQTSALPTAEDKMVVLRELELATKYLRELVMDSNKAYFIAVYNADSGGRILRVYTMLSYITEDQAAHALEELCDPTSGGWDDGYRKVSEEEYDKFNALRELTCFHDALEQAIHVSSKSQSYLETALPFVEKDIKRLRAELGLAYDWEVIAKDVWYTSDDE